MALIKQGVRLLIESINKQFEKQLRSLRNRALCLDQTTCGFNNQLEAFMLETEVNEINELKCRINCT